MCVCACVHVYPSPLIETDNYTGFCNAKTFPSSSATDSFLQTRLTYVIFHVTSAPLSSGKSSRGLGSSGNRQDTCFSPTGALIWRWLVSGSFELWHCSLLLEHPFAGPTAFGSPSISFSIWNFCCPSVLLKMVFVFTFFIHLFTFENNVWKSLFIYILSTDIYISKFWFIFPFSVVR